MTMSKQRVRLAECKAQPVARSEMESRREASVKEAVVVLKPSLVAVNLWC